MNGLSFLTDARNVIYKTSLDSKDRLRLLRNMVLYILGISMETEEYNNTRRDSVIREQARKCDFAFKKVNEWIDVANLSRYYLSYLRRGLINFLKTGDLNYSALSFRCNPEDICLCYDVLKEQGFLEKVIEKIKHEEVKPVFLSDSSMNYIMKQIEYTIRGCLNKTRFLTNNGVEEKSFLETDLKIWAYRVMYMKDGIVDLVYLVNYMKQAITNHSINVLKSYTTQSRNTGLIKVNENEGAKAEYTKIVVPLNDKLGELLVSRDKIKKDGVPEFIEKINFNKYEKIKLKRFFTIINGEQDIEFDEWLRSKGLQNTILDKNGNEYIDLISNLAIEFIGMDYLMPRIRNCWEVFYDCKNLPSKTYRYMQSLNSIFDMQIPIKIKCRVLISKLKYYPDDFVGFLKSNKIKIEEISDEEIQQWIDDYYGSMNQKDLVLYRAALNRITIKM